MTAVVTELSVEEEDEDEDDKDDDDSDAPDSLLMFSLLVAVEPELTTTESRFEFSFRS